MKKEGSDSCVESARSRSDFQEEEEETRFPLRVCVCACVHMCVIDNRGSIEILYKLGSEG